jgi:transposase
MTRSLLTMSDRLRPERRKRNHIRQLEALGYKVTLEPAA